MKAVDDGKLRYVSPSAIKTFDPRAPGGCARKWAFRYVAGIPAPPSQAQVIGTEGHERIEHYLRTGADVLTDLERPGRAWILDPGANLIVEPAIDHDRPIAVLAGVPLVGRLDLVNLTRVYVDPEGQHHDDPTPEIVDWKYSSDPAKWGMTAAQIRDDVAMNSYAAWLVGRGMPAGDSVRLSHVYFGTRRPGALKRTALTDGRAALAVVRSYEPTVVAMKTAAGCKDPNDLPANPAACRAYGGCPYQGVCRRSSDELARMMLADENPKTTEEQAIMSLLQEMTGTPTSGAGTNGASAPPAGSMADRLARLEADEVAAKKSAVPDVRATVAAIEAHGRGFPALAAGEAAQAVAAARGFDVAPGAGLAGSGQIAGLTISTVAELEQIAAELAAFAAQAKVNKATAAAPAVEKLQGAAPPHVSTPAVLPPESRPPSLAESAQPVPPEETLDLSAAVRARADAQRAAAEAVAAALPAPEGARRRGRPATREGELTRLKKPDLVALVLRLESTAAFVADVPGAVTVPDDAAYRGALARNEELDAALAAAHANATELEAQVKLLRSSAVAVPAAGVEIWSDCLPSDMADLRPLDDYIDALCADLCARGNASHVLAAPNDSPLAYGKWRGWVTEAVRKSPPAPGRYFVHPCRGHEVREAVVDALRGRATVHRGV